MGILDPALYTHSPAYLVPGGVYVSTGYHPHSLVLHEVSKARVLPSLYISHPFSYTSNRIAEQR